jgi:hypothetical protein
MGEQLVFISELVVKILMWMRGYGMVNPENINSYLKN